MKRFWIAGGANTVNTRDKGYLREVPLKGAMSGRPGCQAVRTSLCILMPPMAWVFLWPHVCRLVSIIAVEFLREG